jgi:hypothetical protein
LSCAKKTEPRQSGGELLVSPVENVQETESSARLLIDIPGNERIAVVFGYGYNGEDFVASALEYFSAAFVSASGEPVIAAFVFPDDFITGGASRVSLLYDKLTAYNLAGVVLLGSPENTHYALGKLQDSYGGVPVVSLFSQDDQMGTEALSCLVFDFEAKNERQSEDIAFEDVLETEFQQYSEDVPFLLTRVVYYVSLLDSPLSKNGELRVHAQQMFGSEWNILPYVDAETGMQPVNHFVIAKAAHE